MQTIQNISAPGYPLYLTDTRRQLTEWRKPVSGDNCTSGSEVLLLDTAPGGVTKVNIGAGGSAYAAAPTVSFSGGGGSGAAGFAEVSGGAVVQVTITNPGSGYATAPSVTFTPTSGGTGAAATTTLGSASAGNIERIQIALSADPLGTNTSYGSRLNIYRDGEVTAGLQIPLGDLFVHRYSDGNRSSPVRTFTGTRINVNVANTTGLGADRQIFVPFTSRVRVTLTNYTASSGSDAQLFSQVEYRLGAIPAWRGGTGTRRAVLRQAINNSGFTGGGADGYTSVAAATVNTLADVAGVRGELESVMLSVLNTAVSPAFLEGHVKLYADGVLDSESGGTEDYFFNQFYGPGHECHSRGGMPSSDAINSGAWYAASGYRLYGEADNQFTFDDGFQITWQNGLPWINGGSVFYLSDVLYFTDH